MKMTIVREGIFIIFFRCFLITYPIYAAPICPTTTDKHKVVFCGPNVPYSEWDCRECPPGLGLTVKCGTVYSKVYKVHCQECKDGTYSDKNDFGQCKPCSTPCQKNEVQIGECRSDRNTLQCKCKQGYYRASTASCMPCSWCCGDKTNEIENECVNLEKQCSFQDGKSCDPSTPKPMTNYSVTPATGKSSTASQVLSKIATPTTTKVPLSATKGSNNPKSPTDDRKEEETEKESNDKQRNEDKKSDINIGCILGVLFPVLVVVGIPVICCWRRNRNSSGDDSSPEVSSSSLTSNELNSSAPLMSKEESATTKKTEKIQIKSKDTVSYAKGEDGHNGVQPLLTNGTVPVSTTRLDEKELCFICQRLGLKIEDLEHEVMQTLCERLNVSIDDKDYKNLDTFCSLDFFKKRAIEGKENPMQEIIDVMVTQSVTLESFLKELYRISRGDVVQELYKIAKKKKVCA